MAHARGAWISAAAAVAVTLAYGPGLVETARADVEIATSSTASVRQPAAIATATATTTATAGSHAGASVEGLVLDPDGHPAAGVEVALGGSAPRTAGARTGMSLLGDRTTVTDADGRFWFGDHDGYAFAAPGARLGLWARTADGALAAVHDVTPPGPYTLVLAPATTLSIELAAPRHQLDADNYELEVTTPTGTLHTMMATNGSGWTVQGVPFGSYVVRMSTACVHGAPCAGAIERGTIEATGNRVVLIVQPLGELAGVATDPATREPIADAAITCDDGACGSDTSGFWSSVRTDAAGRYRITGQSVGAHTLRFGDAASGAASGAASATPTVAVLHGATPTP